MAAVAVVVYSAKQEAGFRLVCGWGAAYGSQAYSGGTHKGTAHFSFNVRHRGLGKKEDSFVKMIVSETWAVESMHR